MAFRKLPNILCVDDEVDVLLGLRRILRGQCYIVSAVNAWDGLYQLEREGPFAAVISDFRMPDMNGVQFLRKVRKTDPTITRILLTGEAHMQDVESAIREGDVNKILLKPCSTAELRNAISLATQKHDKQIAKPNYKELIKKYSP